MYELVIGNKNYSSWSFRPWLILRQFEVPFEETFVRLNFDGSDDGSSSNKALFEHSPAGRVPVLKDGDAVIWESLAIMEYLNERHGDLGLWPADRLARAHARVVANEMHAGFSALRAEMPMNMRRTPSKIDVSAAAMRDVERVQALWRDCRSRFGAGGPFLFGAFSIADAMYAPVVSRLTVYDVKGDAVVADYMAAVSELAAFEAWKTDALAEPWVIDEEER